MLFPSHDPAQNIAFELSVKVMSSLADTAISVPPVVLPLAKISAKVSTVPTWLSTYALIDCCEATAVAELLAILSSSKNAEPDRVPFNTGLFKVGLVRVLLVSVCDPVKVVTVLSIAKVTELPEAVEVIPVPPIKDIVSVFRLIVMPVVPSETFKLMAPDRDWETNTN